jgi:transcriptional regulator with XRE-family HTH domain
MTALGLVVDWAALGAAIRQRRTEVGMDRGRLAEFAGLTDHHHTTRIEAGTVVYSDRTLGLIADALRTKPALLRDRAWRIYTDTYGGDAA